VPTFTPPTVKQSVGGDRLFSRYGTRVGQSVVKTGGTYRLTPFPWLGDIKDLTEGTDYFLGGRTYTITNEVAADLEVAGFFPVALGYGEGAFGYGAYGG